MRGSVVCVVVLLGMSAGAEAERELQSISRGPRGRLPLAIATVAPHTETSRPARPIDPATSVAVFARINSGAHPVEEAPRAPASIIDQRDFDDRFRVAKKREKKPWRPRVMPHPLSFPTGGGGVKLKIRW